MDEKLPVINLELSSGTFRIKTADALYQITVTSDSSLTRVVERVVEKEAAAEAPPRGAPTTDDPFYREITEEMYTEIGRLARQLSLSIKEIPGETFQGLDIESAGVELEDAKGQLEDIVQMTEKATMDIMDLAESIQGEIQGVETQLGTIKALEFMSQGAPDLDWDDLPDTEAGEGDLKGKQARVVEMVESLLEKANRIREAVSGLPELDDTPVAERPGPAASPAPETKSEKVYTFDPDVVFQTLYELCTNEAVKDHIKAMRADQDVAFDAETVRQSLANMAAGVEVEDNFFNFSITAILKSLFQAANTEKYRQVLKKMNQTASNIFLDSVLPVEGRVEDQPQATTESAPAAAPALPGLPAERIAGLLALVDESINFLNGEKERLEGETGGEDALDSADEAGDYTRVKAADRDVIIGSVEGANTVVQNIKSHITHILETLAFQDLSGQRILKIVRLISDVQVQLLSILVSYGAKLQLRQEELASATPEETQRLAQDEVDKMLERVAAPSAMEGPDADSRLDQDAVNNLLGDLGF